MTNDGWGKAKGWGKPDGWTTQQAVDRAIDVLNPNEIPPKADITKLNEGWPDSGKGQFKIKSEWPELANKTPWIEGLDLGSKDTTVVTTIDKGELEFLLAREVKLNLNSKLFTVDAIQVGDLVIWDDGEFFCISHVPTLARFMNAVPTEDDKEYEHDSLVLWCTKVQRSHHEEWKILRALTPQNHSTKNTEAAEAALRLREWCLSVPIE